MELTVIIIVALLFALAGLGCIVSVAVGLPGAWMIIGFAAVIELVDGAWLTTPSGMTFGWLVLVAAVVLAGFGELLEFLAGVLGAAKAGSSKRGMLGALIGGVVGAILGTAIPVPFIGSLIGAVLGTFVGAVAGELSNAEGSTVRGSLKPATGATIGRILGTLAKVPIAMAIWLMLVIAAFWP